MKFLRGIALPILVLALASCTHGDHDELAHARKRLRPAGCDGGPAVAAVSGVNDSNQYQVYISDWVVLSVCHAADLLKTADAAQKPITLYAEGIDTGNELMGVDAQSGTMTFILDRNNQNREFWRPFLYDPLFDPEVEMHLSVGLKGERPVPRVPNANTIVHVRKIWVDWTTTLFLIGLLIFTIVLPFLGVFIYLITQNDAMTQRDIDRAQAQRAQFDDYVRTTATSGGATAEIEKAKGLLDSGAITQAEFDAIKQKALA